MAIRVLVIIMLWLMPSASASPTYNVDAGHLPARGNSEAPIVIVEFSDFQCKHCRRLQRFFDDLTMLFPNKIQLRFRNSPLDLEEGTFPAEVSEAAAQQGQFWMMHDLLFGARGQITQHSTHAMAQALKLNMAKYETALESGNMRKLVNKDGDFARDLGIDSAPHIFINGRSFRGVKPLWFYAEFIAKELERLPNSQGGDLTLYREMIAGGSEVLRGKGPKPPRPMNAGNRYRVGHGLPEHTFGSTDAIVELVEFLDLQCGFCKKMHPVVERALALYPKQVRVVIRHRPLAYHYNAHLGAEAVVLASMHGKALELIREILSIRRLTPKGVELAMSKVGIPEAQVKHLIASRYLKDLVAMDSARGESMGIAGTPVVLINGRPVIGSVRFESFKQLIDDEIKVATKHMANGIPRKKVIDHIKSTIEDPRYDLVLEPKANETCGSSTDGTCTKKADN